MESKVLWLRPLVMKLDGGPELASNVRLFATGAHVYQSEGRAMTAFGGLDLDIVLVVLSTDFELDDRAFVIAVALKFF